MEPTSFKSEINPGSLKEAVARQDLVLVQIDDWVILQRSAFDIIVNEEPYLALQLYLNTKTFAYITRVWGRTHSRGSVDRTLSDVEELCRNMFAKGCCCPGYWKLEGGVDFDDKNLVSADYPFQRMTSRDCAVMHEQKEVGGEGNSVDLCCNCAALFRPENDLEKEIGNNEKKTSLNIAEMSPVESVDKGAEVKLEADDLEVRDTDPIQEQTEEHSKQNLVYGMCPKKSHITTSLKPEEDLESEMENIEDIIAMSMAEINPVESVDKGAKVKLDSSPFQEHNANEEIEEPFKGNSAYNIRRRKSADGKKMQPINKMPEIQTKEAEPKRTKIKLPCRYRWRIRYPHKWGPRDTWCSPMTHKSHKPKKFSCEHCGKMLTGANSIANHYTRLHQWGNFFCSLCKFFAFYPDEYEVHMLQHHADMEGGVVANCPDCSSEIVLMSTANTFTDHYKECSITLLYHRDKLSREHNQKRKTDSPTVTCDFCGKQLKQRSMRIHMQNHTNEATLKCSYPDCVKRFKHMEAKKIHEQTFHEPKKYPCDRCGKTFKDKSYIKEHAELVHEKKSKDVKCTECALVFPLHSKMYAHRNAVHFPDRFRCENCLKSFPTSGQLKIHLLSHQEGKFPCDICGKKLKRPNQLDEHRRTHTGEKSFLCKYCPYHGTSSSLLCHHKRQVHKAEYEEEKREKQRNKIKVSAELEAHNNAHGSNI